MLSLALCVFCFGALAFADPYTVPDALVEVFRPRGLRISIPDYPGVRLFAVHAVVNRELNGLEAGDISQDVLKKSNGRWVYEDKKIKLNYGDVVNYWLFVIKGHLGYRLDDQTFTVTEFEEAPTDFLSNGKPSRRTTTYSPPPQYVPATPPPFIPPCVCPVPTEAPPAPTCPPITPPEAAMTPEGLAVWRELILTLSNENTELRRRVSVLYDNNELLVAKLQRLGDANINKLILVGDVLRDTDPFALIRTIFMEKLKLYDRTILKNAVRNPDGSITFELRTFEDKLKVLQAAKEYLEGAKFSIKDIEALSFTDSNGQLIIDQRVKPQ